MNRARPFRIEERGSSLVSRGSVVVLLPAIVLVITVGFVAYLASRAQDDYVLQLHAAEVSANVAQLERSLSDARAAAYDYQIAGNIEARNHFAEVSDTVRSERDQLQANLRGSAGGQFARVDKLVEERLGALESLVQVPPGMSTSDPALNALLIRNADVSGELTDALNELEMAVDAPLTVRRANAEASIRRVYVGLFLLAGFAIGGAVMLIIAFRRWVGVRLAQLEDVADTIARREPPGPVDETGDEIGRLAVRLAEVGESLASRELELHQAFGDTTSGWFEIDAQTLTVRVEVPGQASGEARLNTQVRQRPGPIDLLDVHHEDQRRVAESFMETMLLGTPLRVEFRARAIDGRERWFESRGSLVRGADGKPLRLVGISIDITQRKEEELELAAARRRAEEANAAKTEFLSRMSHELRTPLNAVIGFAELLEDDEPLSSRQAKRVGYIRRGGEHLVNLVDDILDISRIESGRLSLSLEPVPLAKLLDDAVAMARSDAAERDVSVVLEAVPRDVFVLADPARAIEVLLNLLTNAIKYNAEHGRVALRADVEDDLVLINVRDTGPGIAPENLERAFEPFERLDADARGVAGAGLGLTLARRLADAMRGSLVATSDPGYGSTFTLTLQWVTGAASAEPKPVVQPLALAANGQRCRIVAIEDDPSARELLEQAFAASSDFDLVTAASGEAGLALVNMKRPAVILLDVNLPDMHGAEVLARLRASSVTSTVPVIIVTADATAETRERFAKVGAYAVVTKPFGPRELVELARSVVAA